MAFRFLFFSYTLFSVLSVTAFACETAQDKQKCETLKKIEAGALSDSKFVQDKANQEIIKEYLKENPGKVTTQVAEHTLHGLKLDKGAVVTVYDPPKVSTKVTLFDSSQFKGGTINDEGLLVHEEVAHRGIIDKKGNVVSVKGGLVELVDPSKSKAFANKQYEILSGSLALPKTGRVLSSKKQGSVSISFDSNGYMTANSEKGKKALFISEKGISDPKKTPIIFSGSLEGALGKLVVGKNTRVNVLAPVEDSDKDANFALETKGERTVQLQLDGTGCTECLGYDPKTASVALKGIGDVAFVPRGINTLRIANIPEGTTLSVGAKGDTVSKLKKIEFGDIGKGKLIIHYTDKSGKPVTQVFQGKELEIKGIKEFPEGFTIERIPLKIDSASLNPFSELVKNLDSKKLGKLKGQKKPGKVTNRYHPNPYKWMGKETFSLGTGKATQKVRSMMKRMNKDFATLGENVVVISTGIYRGSRQGCGGARFCNSKHYYGGAYDISGIVVDGKIINFHEGNHAKKTKYKYVGGKSIKIAHSGRTIVHSVSPEYRTAIKIVSKHCRVWKVHVGHVHCEP